MATKGGKKKKFEGSKDAAYGENAQKMRVLSKGAPFGFYEYGIFPDHETCGCSQYVASGKDGSPKECRHTIQQIRTDNKTLTYMDHRQTGIKGGAKHVFPMEPQRKKTGPLALVG